jgi:hypothetical protein
MRLVHGPVVAPALVRLHSASIGNLLCSRVRSPTVRGCSGNQGGRPLSILIPSATAAALQPSPNLNHCAPIMCVATGFSPCSATLGTHLSLPGLMEALFSRLARAISRAPLIWLLAVAVGLDLFYSRIEHSLRGNPGPSPAPDVEPPYVFDASRHQRPPSRATISHLR